MAHLNVDAVSKEFGTFNAVNNVSLDVRDGEFLAVLGPSGCGKTTLLRLIAGFEEVTRGRIAIGDRTMSSPTAHLPPEHRRIGIVFQSYALWPHMTVSENVGYSLKVAGAPSDERHKRVLDALAMVGLADFGGRRPAMLSGGERQRVALARCLVAAPSLILLDEPLANLDVHLRASMEDEFTDFHRRTGTTMFYITHDQSEAMALADRIAVMDHGRVVQVATPLELYREPATEMVAGFIGQGMVVPAEIRTSEAEGRCHARIFGHDTAVRCRPGQKVTATGAVCVHPRELSVVPAGVSGIPGRVRRVVYRGGYLRAEVVPDAASDVSLNVEIVDPEALRPGIEVGITLNDGWAIPASGT
ncbi:MAG: ABC transporter ATP-binding protein [Rhodospirillales bacterium]|nr:ABC transporter ATP-binding protein [Rhodospirillales bacterium]